MQLLCKAIREKKSRASRGGDKGRVKGESGEISCSSLPLAACWAAHSNHATKPRYCEISVHFYSSQQPADTR